MGQSIILRVITLMGIGFYSLTSVAITFNSLRDDQYVPSHCKNVQMQHFGNSQIQVFLVGITGASERGFTFEFPIERHEARTLYKAITGSEGALSEVLNQQRLYTLYVQLLEEARYRGVDFSVEGDILELLATSRIQANLNAWSTGYYITGGISYNKRGGNSTTGELDLVIADSITCTVVGYGEAKLGSHRIGKAREQIQRFSYHLGNEGVNHTLVAPTVNYMQ